ncbi:MAG: thiamine phosphate synthase [Magnetococcales bacterium]|nr:thiamine phosphate synthase [Magnetococcales bacterium]
MSVALPRLLLITEPVVRSEGEVLLWRLKSALSGGACHLLLRLPGWCGRDLYALAEVLRREVASPGSLLIHDRPDVALAVGADGVHLSSAGLPTQVVRQLLGSDLLLGRSCHDPETANRALAEGADYVTLSPLFATRSHPGAQPLGSAAFASQVCAISGPVVALGGVTPDNAAEALSTGATGVAVIRSILHAENPARATRQLLDILQNSPVRGESYKEELNKEGLTFFDLLSRPVNSHYPGVAGLGRKRKSAYSFHSENGKCIH